MKKIRMGNKRPNEDGELTVTPTMPKAKKRTYIVHEQPGPDGRHTLYPKNGHNLMSLPGKMTAALIKEHLDEQKKPDNTCKTFEEHLRRNVELTPEKPENPQAADPQECTPRVLHFDPL